MGRWMERVKSDRVKGRTLLIRSFLFNFNIFRSAYLPACCAVCAWRPEFVCLEWCLLVVLASGKGGCRTQILS